MCKYLDCRNVTIKSGQTRRIFTYLVTGRYHRRLVVGVKLREGVDRERGAGAMGGTVSDQSYVAWLIGMNVKNGVRRDFE